jgi:hypothetical protein
VFQLNLSKVCLLVTPLQCLGTTVDPTETLYPVLRYRVHVAAPLSSLAASPSGTLSTALPGRTWADTGHKALMPGVIVWLSLLSCGVCTEQIKCMQGGWTHTRALSRIGCHALALWLDHYVRDAAGTVYGTQLVISLTTKQDYKLHVATASGLD